MSAESRVTTRTWVERAAGLLAGGTVGSALFWAVLSRLLGVESPLVPVIVGAALAVPVVGLPLWRVVLRAPRTGPWWGGLIGAWIPPVIVAALAVGSAIVGDLSGHEAVTAAALLYLAALPLTLVLSGVGALLELWRSRSER